MDDLDFETYSVNIDSYCYSNDFDEYDLFGDRLEDDTCTNELANNIIYE